MGFPTVLCLGGLAIALQCSSSCHATPLTFNLSTESSGDGEELDFLIPTSGSTNNTAFPPSTADTSGKTHTRPFHVGQIVNFFRENLFPILVISSLLILIILIFSSAYVLSRKRKISAYYPSSFPAKMYVDERDKSGGLKVFNEVPEKPPGSSDGELVDSAKRLQADILMIAKNLRTPGKGVREEPEPNDVQKSGLHQEPDASNQPEEQDSSQVPSIKEDTCRDQPLDPVSGKAEAQEENALPSGPVPQETAETQEAAGPTVQFISGEKTAF
ncbi:transmembrane protein 119b [Denticeps clupeoides]|uniref:Transmembrane protein 119 n=1 Tax=Denticeps clupeoides TaxID=299321 RepID=A0AAY4BCU7_9TELE|nr:transmembrane protein 119-like [Denticeps clupeoides]